MSQGSTKIVNTIHSWGGGCMGLRDLMGSKPSQLRKWLITTTTNYPYPVATPRNDVQVIVVVYQLSFFYNFLKFYLSINFFGHIQKHPRCSYQEWKNKDENQAQYRVHEKNQDDSKNYSKKTL